MTNETNRIEPGAFAEKLQQATGALWDLLELCRERDCRVASPTNAHLVDPAYVSPYDIANQYERPTDFLQTLLDLFRSIYEPASLGTFFLNGNLGFLIDALPDEPFQLGYATLTGDAEQPFDQFWEETVLPYLSGCGYRYETALAVFGVVSTAIEHYDLQLVDSVLNVVGAGLSPEEALGMIAAAVEGRDAPRTKTLHFGFCLDPALESKRRLSLWLVLPGATEGKIHHLQHS
jgi:hypothetical protein